MATIAARGLAKSYAGKPAVVDLSFDVEPGSVTGFLGPNGSGKSTTMRLMLGLDRGAGSTRFDGQAFTDLEQPMRQVGALLEAKPFHPTRTARNHLRMLAAANGISAKRVDEVLAVVGLTEVARSKPKSFSLGMGQRLGLAAALLGDPHTLILDEPANGLDPQGIQWMRVFLQGLAAEGRSVFVSSHLLSEMALMADHLVVIGRGALIATGPIADFVSSSRQNAIIVRTPDGSTLAPLLVAAGAAVTPGEDGSLVVTGVEIATVGDVAFEHGIRLHELSPRVATLEEAFLERTAGSEEFQALGRPTAPGGGAR
ncbi:ABC-2 type transport system ATP-binding protein [Marmoricola sp. OAE513]|uniref:ATP-binding cassette domain-containing protein n=1 Tax=Marmoricola sp. OAE513 TaxID=2817894 RepID=UPI001AE81FE7